MKKLKRDCFQNEYVFAAKMLRISFGILFVLVAVKKLRMGYTGFADGLVSGDGHMASEVPAVFLYVYGLIIPALELVAGVFLLANRHVKEAYMAIGFMYLTFIFGQMYDGNTSKVGTEYLPSIVALCLAVFFGERANKA